MILLKIWIPHPKMNWFYAARRCDSAEGDILELWFVGVVVNERWFDLIKSNKYFSVLPQFILNMVKFVNELNGPPTWTKGL
jgi:hypothetical protein